MEQEILSIYSFTKGDIITRVKPSLPIKIVGDETIQDRTYIGEPLVFLGIVNGCAYVEKQESYDMKKDMGEIKNDPLNFFSIFLNKTRGPIILPLDVWDNNWTLYIDPYSLGVQDSSTETADIKILEKQLKLALHEERYERADEIKVQITRIKNN